MKLLSWNVNGIRSALDKGLLRFIADSSPDVLCLQEVKALPEQVDIDLPHYHMFWNPAERKGYSGTAIFSRPAPLATSTGIGMAKHDREGRVLTAEFEAFFLVNVYAPNAQRRLERLDYRLAWEADFLGYLKRLEHRKPVVFCGDLNVAHQERDLANPKSNRRNAGFTPEERAAFQDLIDAGFIDTFREFEQEGGHYTWWRQMYDARARNLGWRIDYFLISASLRGDLQQAFILPQIMGSDHCPVGIVLTPAGGAP